ncbi:MAG: RNA polymerase sigma factor [Pirellulales bacterium]
MIGPETRHSMLVQLQDSSQHESWQEFIEIYEPLVYQLARKKGLQHTDALDLTQEVFLAVSRSIERFDLDQSKGSFRGWLFKIARNLMINFLTRQKEPQGSGDTGIHMLLSDMPVSDPVAETLFGVEYQRELFRWAAQRVRQDFHEETWRAFWMTGVEGETIKDVAKMLGKTTGAIRIARCRVIVRLKQEITRFEESNIE